MVLRNLWYKYRYLILNLSRAFIFISKQSPALLLGKKIFLEQRLSKKKKKGIVLTLT